MGDYHFVYKDLDGASTQWDDLQRKHGNLPPKPPVFKPPAFAPAEDESSLPKDKSWIDRKTEDELEDLDDDDAFDDDRFLEEYRYSFCRSRNEKICILIDRFDLTNMNWSDGMRNSIRNVRTVKVWVFINMWLFDFVHRN